MGRSPNRLETASNDNDPAPRTTCVKRAARLGADSLRQDIDVAPAYDVTTVGVTTAGATSKVCATTTTKRLADHTHPPTAVSPTPRPEPGPTRARTSSETHEAPKQARPASRSKVDWGTAEQHLRRPNGAALVEEALAERQTSEA